MTAFPLGSKQTGLGGADAVPLAVHRYGDGPLVVLVHGFPDLGYGWRHQVPPLVAAGYRVLVPDMRGYGRSGTPARVDAYRIDRLAADLLGLLDLAEAERAVFVGHDWGASVVWHVAATCPERVRGAAGLSVPFAPPAPAPPLEILRRRLGDDFYMVWFQQAGPADAALRADIRRTMVSAFAGGPDPLNWRGHSAARPDWLTEPELETYVEAFARTGFSGGLGYYRNIDANWRLARRLGVERIDPPALFATGSADPITRFMPVRRSSYADLRGHVVLDGAGHWLHQERPDEVTNLLLEFLDSLS